MFRVFLTHCGANKVYKTALSRLQTVIVIYIYWNCSTENEVDKLNLDKKPYTYYTTPVSEVGISSSPGLATIVRIERQCVK